MALGHIETDELKRASDKLLEIEGEVKNLANNIQNCAGELKSGYNDEAGRLFIQKINELDGDVQQMIKMIEEHGQELAATATDVENLLEESKSGANALPTDVIH